jgi:hypothetical protein
MTSDVSRPVHLEIGAHRLDYRQPTEEYITKKPLGAYSMLRRVEVPRRARY